jgi:hypothetical protein
MIFVLGISLILVDSLYLLNLVKKEGFWGDALHEGFDTDKYQLDDIDERDQDQDVSQNKITVTKSKINNDAIDILKLILNANDETKQKKTIEKFGEDEDEDSEYMHDKSIIKKLKQLNPIILNTIENMNSLHIKEINKTINELTNKMDP